MFKEPSADQLRSSIYSIVEEMKVSELKKLERDLRAKKDDWWDELTPAQKRSINKGLKEVKEGKVITHAEMKKTFAKLKKKWAAK